MERLPRRVALIGATLITLLAAPAAASALEPIVFVHGWNSSGSTWNTMASRFAAAGYPASHLDKWSYTASQSNATTAQQLASEVQRVRTATGAAKVDIVSHSMGGLSSRYYLKNLGGQAAVDEWVSIAGPNHGTNFANLCFQTSCYEMRAGSSFLTALNSGDETPGDTVRYATWWSPCDEVINPDTSTILSGATNTQTGCLSHSGIKDSATTYSQVANFVR
jgi:triacylglycerol lipase